MTALLVVLWVVPVTLVASITTLETLDVWARGLEDYQDINPVAQGIIQGVIPTLLLAAFMAVLPMVMKCKRRERRHWRQRTAFKPSHF